MKCHTKGCEKEPKARVYWPTGEILMCVPCAERAQRVGGSLGMTITVEALPEIVPSVVPGRCAIGPSFPAGTVGSGRPGEPDFDDAQKEIAFVRMELTNTRAALQRLRDDLARAQTTILALADAEARAKTAADALAKLKLEDETACDDCAMQANSTKLRELVKAAEPIAAVLHEHLTGGFGGEISDFNDALEAAKKVGP